MSDDSIDAIPAEAFAFVRDLIAVLADSKRTTAVLLELEKRLSDARKQEHRAQTIIDRHNVQIARDNTALDERRAELSKKARELMTRESMCDVREKALERTKVTHRDSSLFGGLTREEFKIDGREKSTG